MIKVRILGLSGTPVLGGNCDTLVQETLKAAAELGDVETEFVTLADKKIAMCTHCQYCIENRTSCKVEDDAHMIFDKMEQADGIILGGPTWFGTLCPTLPILFSRARFITFFTNRFRNKAGGAVTVGWLGLGMEPALTVIETLMACVRMLPVARGWALSSTVAFGERGAQLEHGVLDDKKGIDRVKNVGIRVVEVARMTKYAAEAGIVLPAELQRNITGGSFAPLREKKLIEGVWR